MKSKPGVFLLMFTLRVSLSLAGEFSEQKIFSPQDVFGRDLAIAGSRLVTIQLDPNAPHTNRHIVTLERGNSGWRIADTISGEHTFGIGYMQLWENELFFAVNEHLRPFVRVTGGWGRTGVIGFNYTPELFSVYSFKVVRDRIAAVGAIYREMPRIHIIERWGANWIKKREIPPSDPSSYIYNLALSGDKLMAAEQYVDEGKLHSRVHIYDVAADYARITLEAPKTNPSNNLANELALAGDWAFVSYSNADFTNGTGAIYAYRFNGSTKSWDLLQEIRPDMPMFDGFASSMAVSGRKLLVGAPYRNEAQARTGAAFLFELADTVPGERPRWYERKKFVASDARSGDEFGRQVAVSGDTYVIGAVGNKSAIHVFEELVPMQVQRTRRGVRLLWPAKYQGSRLQSSDSVAGPWKTIFPARWSETENWVVDVQPSADREFYRVVRE